MPERPVVCFYHKNCVDGTTAAAVVLKKFPEARAFPLGFDSAVADLQLTKETILSHTLIIYVDNVIGLEEILELGNEVFVIDHHISEYDIVQKLAQVRNNLTYVYDQEESGASLTWKYFFKDLEVPELILHVRDIDLRKDELLPYSNWTYLYLSLFRNKPEALKNLINEAFDSYLVLGKILAEFVEDEVLRAIDTAPVFIQVGEWRLPAYNITNHQHKAGVILSRSTGGVVILYTFSGEMVRLSIRSTAGQTPNALEVALVFGGGGHEDAAGAGVERNYFLSLIK